MLLFEMIFIFNNLVEYGIQNPEAPNYLYYWIPCFRRNDARGNGIESHACEAMALLLTRYQNRQHL